MVAGTTMGPEHNLFDPQSASAHQIELRSPLIYNDEMAKLRALDGWRGFRSRTLSTVYRVAGGRALLGRGPRYPVRRGSAAVGDGCQILILSDRGFDRDRAPMPALLSCAAVHHQPVARRHAHPNMPGGGSGEPREVPRFLSAHRLRRQRRQPLSGHRGHREYVARIDDPVDEVTARTNYTKAISKGMVKVISKMGISTVQSYHGLRCSRPSGCIPRWSTNISWARHRESAAWS